MREIAGIIYCLLTPSSSQAYPDLKVFHSQNFTLGERYVLVFTAPCLSGGFKLTALSSSTFSGSPFTRSFSSLLPSVGMNETLVFSGTTLSTPEYPVAQRMRPQFASPVKSLGYGGKVDKIRPRAWKMHGKSYSRRVQSLRAVIVQSWRQLVSVYILAPRQSSSW